MDDVSFEQYHGERKLNNLASETLAKFAKIADAADAADAALAQSRPVNAGVLANPSHAGLQGLARVQSFSLRDAARLEDEPAVGRAVLYKPAATEINVYYFCRATPPSGARDVVSYRSPMGRLAALPLDETFDLGQETGLSRYDNIDVKKIQHTEYRPEQTPGGWDSRGTIYRDSLVQKSQTIASLLNLIEKAESGETERSPLEELLRREAREANVYMGLKRGAVEKFSLADARILDSAQDGVFRAPVNSSLLLLGPAGAGKTTTLIYRLGQKLDFDNGLTEEEQKLVLKIFGSQQEYKASWIMFTPTDLLKSYLKEAFNREGIAAPDEHLKTWDAYRMELGRALKILKTAVFDSGMVYDSTRGAKTLRDGFDETAELRGDFIAWLLTDYADDVAQALDKSMKQNLLEKSKTIDKIYAQLPRLKKSGTIYLADLFNSLFDLQSSLSSIYKREKEALGMAVRKDLDARLKKNSRFLDEYANFLASLKKKNEYVAEENDAAEDIIDDEDGSGSNAGKTGEVLKKYRSLLLWLASTPDDFNFDKSDSREAKQIKWLGDRRPDPDLVKTVRKSSAALKAIAPLRDPLNKFLNSVGSRYRNFRKLRRAEGKYYHPDAALLKSIEGTELDLLIFAKLSLASSLRRDIVRGADASLIASLRAIEKLYIAQVFVDEAPDFSPLQLGCARLLAHPSIDSFFACGDFNQRLTPDGAKNSEEFASFFPARKIESKVLSVAYRQTTSLRKFSQDVLRAKGAEPDGSREDNAGSNEGFAPTLGENLADAEQTASWLADRVVEIERVLDGALPSIAVLTPGEDYVKPVADALEKALSQRTSAQVQPCYYGQTIGNQKAIRVFDIKHIKGLEFKAAFFVGLDKLAERVPDLFYNYLYVGATRAAQFLGAACEGELTGAECETLRGSFVAAW